MFAPLQITTPLQISHSVSESVFTSLPSPLFAVPQGFAGVRWESLEMCCPAGPSMTSTWGRSVLTCAMAEVTASMEHAGVIRDITVSRLCDQGYYGEQTL